MHGAGKDAGERSIMSAQIVITEKSSQVKDVVAMPRTRAPLSVSESGIPHECPIETAIGGARLLVDHRIGELTDLLDLYRHRVAVLQE